MTINPKVLQAAERDPDSVQPVVVVVEDTAAPPLEFLADHHVEIVDPKPIGDDAIGMISCGVKLAGLRAIQNLEAQQIARISVEDDSMQNWTSD